MKVMKEWEWSAVQLLGINSKMKTLDRLTSTVPHQVWHESNKINILSSKNILRISVLPDQSLANNIHYYENTEDLFNQAYIDRHKYN